MKKANINVVGLLFGSLVQYNFKDVFYKIENNNLIVKDCIGITRIFPQLQFLWEVIDIDL